MAFACLAACSSKAAEERAAEGGPAAEAGAQPVDPVAVAGMWGLRMRSTVVFDVMPDSPHGLTAVFAFPERGFWRLQQKTGRSFRRRLVYRLGDQVVQVPPEEADSQPLEGSEAQDLLLQMDLRLAAMLWPDGQPWTPGQDPDRVVLPGLGSLETHGATIDGPPRRFVAYRQDGSELEALSEVEWARKHGRLWPRRWVLEMPGEVLWREEIEEVDPSGFYSDGYFLPYDRVDQQVVRESDSFDAGILQEIVLPERSTRRFPLPEGSTWMEALAEARSLHAHWKGTLELTDLDRRVEIELSDAGRPVAVRLRLSGERSAPLPEGWEWHPSCRGASKLVSDPPRIDAGLVRRLRSRLPAEERAGVPYALLDLGGAQADASGQLVVPAQRSP